MINYANKLSAVLVDCLVFTANNPLDECLKASHFLVESYGLGDKVFGERIEELYSNQPDSLASKILRRAVVYHGVFMFYAGFLFLSGNSQAADLRCRQAEIESEEAGKALMEMTNQSIPEIDEEEELEDEE